MFLLLISHYVMERFEYTDRLYTKSVAWMKRKLKHLKMYLYNPHCCCSKKERHRSDTFIGHTTGDAVTHTSIALDDVVTLREALLENSVH